MAEGSNSMYAQAFAQSGKVTVSYEDFGAVGDGVTDDFAAIRQAHAYANDNNLRVVTNPTKSYYIGASTETAIIMTDTDWTTSRITIDDHEVTIEDRRTPVFHVMSRHQPIALDVKSIKKYQGKLNVTLPGNALVIAEDENDKQFMRVGLNQSAGHAKTDCFIIDQTGHVITPIIWDFNNLTKIIAYPIDERTLTIRGGEITTIANRSVQPRYNYYSRGIQISRSNVIFDGMVHGVTGELECGSPYHGFVRPEDCAHVSFRNCHFTGHKIYVTIGAIDKPVSMGTYDISAYRSVDISFINCQEDNIMDMTLWGVFTSNYCKQILLDGCTFSRVDAHMDVTDYTIRNTTLGWQGLNAIGHGKLTVENVVILGPTVVSLRGDYGSTWEGDVSIKDVTWYPLGNRPRNSVIGGGNTGDHNFGYTCSMPRRITIENLRVMDAGIDNPEYDGISLLGFSPETNTGVKSFGEPAQGDYPYLFTRFLNATGLTTQSGKGFKVWSSDPTNCYLDKCHSVEETTVRANFKAVIDDVDALNINLPEQADPALYGCNHRMVPEIIVSNCDAVTVSESTIPANIIVVE